MQNLTMIYRCAYTWIRTCITVEIEFEIGLNLFRDNGRRRFLSEFRLPNNLFINSGAL